MKTRTSQNGVAGLMSWLLHNIKSAALAIAALVLAAPSAWGAYTSGMQWKDGVSGNLNAAGNWTGGKAPASGNILGFAGYVSISVIAGIALVALGYFLVR